MVARSRWLTVGRTISFVAILAIVVACAKQRTTLAMRKVDKLITEAEQKFNAREHVPQELDQAINLRRQAETAANQQDYKQSVTLAREAVRTAKRVLEQAKYGEATKQRGEADREVAVMNKNNGAKENPQLYQEIIDLQNRMRAKYEKQRYVATIELAREIKQKVEQLLLRLRRAANDDLVAVQAEYRRLIDEGGREHALMYVQRVEDKIQQIEQNINVEKDYLTAIALAQQAMIDAQEGIIETKRKKCEIEIDVIQRDLILAQQLKAEFFVPDLWNACSEDFAKLVENFWRKEYDFVLKASSRLKSQVKTLIYETRLASARYQRDKLDQRIAELENKGVETYLPGSLPPLKKALEQANERLKAEAFDEVESICKSAQIQADEIMKKFRALADQWIQKARDISERAQSVFQEMQRIFREVHPTYVKPIDQALEDNKQAIKEDLSKRLEQARVNVQRAEAKHTSEDYREAIELSRAVQDEATTVLATIYNVVAHNVITEIADQVTRYDREGAPEYAASEMALTKKLLQEAVDLRDQGQFKASAAKAAEARAQLEVTIQAIEVTAARAIEKARAALKESDKTKTSQLQPEKYQRALQYINEAKMQLETTRLKDAVLTAQRAENLIREASRDAAQLWATQTLERADQRLADARNSGADIYAAQLLREAGEDLAQARAAFAAAEALRGQKEFEKARDKFIEAKDLAIQAAEGAVRAKFRLIDEAEAAIVEARFYEGWRNQLPRLTEAVLQLDRAKQAMAEGKFDLSHELARQAAAEAKKVTAASKSQIFQKRLEVVDSLIQEATRSGGRYYQPRLLASLGRELDRLREQYRSDTFDTNAKRMAEIEARLQGLLNSMPDVVAEWIKSQRERLAEIEGGDIPPTFQPRISEAKKFLRFAEMDFKRGKYRSSYSNLLVGRRIVDELAGDQAEIEYLRALRKIMDDFKQCLEDFDHFLGLDPKTLTGLTRGAWGEKQFIAIAGKATPQDFRQRIDALVVDIQALQAPASMKEFHDEMVEVLRLARMAAINYERMTALSEFDRGTRMDIIRKAYDIMEEVRKRRARLEEMLLPRSAEKQKI